MLDLDDQEPGGVLGDPVFVKGISIFLLDPVIAAQPEPGRVVGLQVGVGRRLPETLERVGEVTMVDDQRVSALRMLIKPFRDKDISSEEHWLPPEPGQTLTLDLDMLDVLRFRRVGNGRDLLVDDDADNLVAAGLQMHLYLLTIEIPRF